MKKHREVDKLMSDTYLAVNPKTNKRTMVALLSSSNKDEVFVIAVCPPYDVWKMKAGKLVKVKERR